MTDRLKTFVNKTLPIWFVVSSLLLFSAVPNLIRSHHVFSASNSVAFLVDFEDLEVFSYREHRPLSSLLAEIKEKGVSAVAIAYPGADKDIRHHELGVFWKSSGRNNASIPEFLQHLSMKDGLLPANEGVWGFPGYLDDVIKVAKEKKNWVAQLEFFSAKGAGYFHSHVPSRLIKTHVLTAEEQLHPKRELWMNRLLRAVNERSVRCLYFRLAPSWSWEENMNFISSCVDLLEKDQWNVALPNESLMELWRAQSTPATFLNKIQTISIRNLVVLFLGLTVPLVGFFLAKRNRNKTPVVTFLMISFLSVLGGLAIYGWGSHPYMWLGITPIRGVKIMLAGPLLLLFCYTCWENKLVQMDRPITTRMIIVFGGLFFGLGGLYLMRSGNFPLIGVTDMERHLRDGLEHVFIARPRFKEAFIGHPLLIFGLYLRHQGGKPIHWFQRGEFWIILGFLGQVSVLNTFVHTHTPIMISLIRTFHGIWIGLLISPFLCTWGSKALHLEIGKNART